MSKAKPARASKKKVAEVEEIAAEVPVVDPSTVPWHLCAGTEISIAGHSVTLLADVPVELPGDSAEKVFVGFLVALSIEAFQCNASQLDGNYDPRTGVALPEESDTLASDLP